ncbi:methyltransferase domain-containing protein [Candidatus Jorgensenbacteria bacterium]|nr:methyltransferase domain-containing protein [Candidatus Jorgensenbacteria bacterium]
MNFTIFSNTSYRRRLVDRDLYQYRHIFSGVVLDLGGGRTRGSFPHGKSLGWVVLDKDNTLQPTIVGDAQVLPFRNDSFDAVKCSELTGYLFEPLKMLREVERILKPGGTAIFTSPYLTPFDFDQHDGIRLTNAWWEWAARRVGLYLGKVEPEGFLLTVLADFEKYWISHWWLPLRYAAYVVMFPIYETLFWYEKKFPMPKYFERFTSGFFVLLKKPS